MKDELARFEAAMRSEYKWPDHYFAREEGGEYRLTITMGAWAGWITHVRCAASLAAREEANG